MFSIIKLMNRADVNSSWWSGVGLNMDVGQCDALKLRLFFSTMPIPQGLPPHRQLGWHGSPPAYGRSESSPRCVLMPAVGHTENFSTPTLNSLYCKHQHRPYMIHQDDCRYYTGDGKSLHCDSVKAVRTVAWPLNIHMLDIYDEWMWGSWVRLIRLCHQILLGKLEGTAACHPGRGREWEICRL